jgi:hypothetical protein
MKIRVLVLISSIAFLTGCMSGTMNSIMKSWDNAHIDEVVSQWGYPTYEEEFRGKKLYVWTESLTTPGSKGYFVPGTSASSHSTGTINGDNISIDTNYTSGTQDKWVGGYSGSTISDSCKRTMTVDSDGYVVSWRWSGSFCPKFDALDRNWTKK